MAEAWWSGKCGRCGEWSGFLANQPHTEPPVKICAKCYERVRPSRSCPICDNHIVSYADQLADPAWTLLDADGKVVASIRAPTAIEARDTFKREGLTGVRVTRAAVAPVVQEPRLTGPPCVHCGEPIDAARDYRIVTGYERISRGGQGGTNAIRAPRRTERYGCARCVDKLASGVAIEQAEFDLAPTEES